MQNILHGIQNLKMSLTWYNLIMRFLLCILLLSDNIYIKIYIYPDHVCILGFPHIELKPLKIYHYKVRCSSFCEDFYLQTLFQIFWFLSIVYISLYITALYLQDDVLCSQCLALMLVCVCRLTTIGQTHEAFWDEPEVLPLYIVRELGQIYKVTINIVASSSA